MSNPLFSRSESSSLQGQPDQSASKSKTDYAHQLKAELSQVIDQLDDLNEKQKIYLKSRWLDQVLWMDGRANNSRNWYRRLRLTSIILGVIVPILVTLDMGSGLSKQSKEILIGATIVLSSIIAISAAVEEFNQFGKRWYSYRRSAELLKTNGWQFFQGGGQYRTYKSHQDAFPLFVDQVEAIVQRDVEIFVDEGIKEKQKDEKTSEDV